MLRIDEKVVLIIGFLILLSVFVRVFVCFFDCIVRNVW